MYTMPFVACQTTLNTERCEALKGKIPPVAFNHGEGRADAKKCGEQQRINTNVLRSHKGSGLPQVVCLLDCLLIRQPNVPV